MTKQEWQVKHDVLTDEMDWIEQTIKETNGTIKSVSEVPRDSKGCPIPFAERRESGDRLRSMW